MTDSPIRCLIADDESLARLLIKEYLSSHPSIEVICECDNGEDAINQIIELQPDLVILDMQMPVFNGLEVIAKTGRESGVIFSTAFDQYAVAAFDKNAIDYLLKPYSQERFDKAIQKFRQQQENSISLANLLHEQHLYAERIQVKDRGNHLVICVKDISHILAEDDYIELFFQRRSLLKTQALSDIEKQLDPKQFVRIHRSTIINLNFLEHWEKSGKDTYEAILTTGAKLSISRSGLERLKERIQQAGSSSSKNN